MSARQTAPCVTGPVPAERSRTLAARALDTAYAGPAIAGPAIAGPAAAVPASAGPAPDRPALGGHAPSGPVPGRGARVVGAAAVAVAALVVVALAGCSGASAGGTAVASSPPAAPDAQQVVEAFADAGLPVRDMVVYTAETDLNDMLGRPGGYTSKAAFVDTRIDVSDVGDTSEGAIELGGGVEVFDDADGAHDRATYIQGIAEALPFAAREYDYVAGGVLVRLSVQLTPDQAARYGTALASLTGVQPVLVEV